MKQMSRNSSQYCMVMYDNSCFIGFCMSYNMWHDVNKLVSVSLDR